MGFYDDIRRTYGAETTTRMKKYHSNQYKISSLKNRKLFLIKCRSHALLPHHIAENIGRTFETIEYMDPRTAQQIRNQCKRLGNKILSMEISVTIKNLNRLLSYQAQIKDSLIGSLPGDIWFEFSSRMHIAYNRAFHDIRRTQQRKFDFLFNSQFVKLQTKPHWFKNLSQTTIPTNVAEFLSLGPNFSIEPTRKEVPILKILAEVETTSYENLPVSKSIVSNRVANLITNFINKQECRANQFQLLFNQSRKFLKENAEIMITRADKGNVTVCMDVHQYTQLSLNILSDTEFYQPINRDPTTTFQQKANKLIVQLKKDNMVTPEEAKQLMIYNSKPARFYGLPKIHKPQLSLRPIISSISCPNSKIANLATTILSKSYNKNNRYYISDSFQFSEFINNFELPYGYVLVSFDVVSLFTNIPLQLLIDSISDKWSSISQHCKIPYFRFIKLVDFIFHSTYFTFNNRFYKQIYGTPMGSEVSPIAAQYVMDMVLDKCIAKLPFKIPFIKKYVDDIICAVPEQTVAYTLYILNSFHQKIQFTVENETNFSVPFLDTLVIRRDTVVVTDWYTKPTSSGRYINYFSYHSHRMKTNVILNMKNRILKLSNPEFHNTNLQKLYRIMKQNSYPSWLLKKIIFGVPTRNPIDRRQIAVELTPAAFTYKSLPYYVGLSDRIASLFNQIPGIKFAYYNCKKIGDIYTSLKDKTPPLQQSDVVYSVKCGDCPKIYIGQTGRNLSARITSHRSDIRLNKTSCQLSIHSNTSLHSPDYSSVKILDVERHWKKRLFLEMVRISQTDDPMNSRRDIEGLSDIYSNIIQLLKNNNTRRRENSLDTTDTE